MTIGRALDSDPIEEARRQWVGHGWAEAADGMAAVTSIVRAQQILLQRIDAVLRPLDLTFARYEILMLLSFTRKGALPMTRMGALLQVHPTSVTSAVDRLETQGFVKRQPHPTDRRAVLAAITQAGRARGLAATTALNAQVFEQLGITTNQIDTLRTVLRALRANAGDF
ncbi:MAG: MarR family transcriptional regulator [Candidatus Nanopelagicales bacterium]|jgi:DNA-binding MarR family transcriptional regulator|nr:MarR family transcriptional regulator [Candidatus Nanopelagicales bacterium]